MVRGTVKWFNDKKGFGFVHQDDGPDCFVHYSSILEKGHKTLEEGDVVAFEVENSGKGPKAVNVRKV